MHVEKLSHINNRSIHAFRMKGDGEPVDDAVFGYQISIHALRMEGDSAGGENPHRRNVSIHTLREEGDRRYTPRGMLSVFQSTPSVRRATLFLWDFKNYHRKNLLIVQYGTD